MSNLFPTPTRIQLLRDVEIGEVWQTSSDESVLTDDRGLVAGRRCTADIRKFENAGWVHLYEFSTGARQWQLTDKGREILAGAS